ncbi:MAG: hypothetical protein OXR66_02390 [Candidatus Woesearchaeota archaeon]|nr:hypothetical protein [Candidatus Woesearchaeota archaeon]
MSIGQDITHLFKELPNYQTFAAQHERTVIGSDLARSIREKLAYARTTLRSGEHTELDVYGLPSVYSLLERRKTQDISLKDAEAELATITRDAEAQLPEHYDSTEPESEDGQVSIRLYESRKEGRERRRELRRVEENVKETIASLGASE